MEPVEVDFVKTDRITGAPVHDKFLKLMKTDGIISLGGKPLRQSIRLPVRRGNKTLTDIRPKETDPFSRCVFECEMTVRIDDHAPELSGRSMSPGREIKRRTFPVMKRNLIFFPRGTFGYHKRFPHRTAEPHIGKRCGGDHPDTFSGTEFHCTDGLSPQTERG